MTINPLFEEYSNGTARAYFGGSRAPVATLSAVGASMIIYMNFMERCTKVTAVTLDVRNESGSWYLRRRYVYSTDAITWSAPMDINALTALVFDPALPLYIGLDMPVNGATSLSTIELWHCQVNFEVDFVNGVIGRKEPNEERIYIACREIVEQLVNQISPLYDEQIHYQFAWGTGEKCVPDGNKPNVFVHDLRILDRTRNSDHRQRTMGFRFGIRRKCTPGHKYFEEFRGIVKRRLGEQAQEFTYDFTVNGVKHLGVTLGDMGYWSVMTSADAEIAGSDQSSKELACGCTWWETSVQMQILFKFDKIIR